MFIGLSKYYITEIMGKRSQNEGHFRQRQRPQTHAGLCCVRVSESPRPPM
jgi:hypothetical protein